MYSICFPPFCLNLQMKLHRDVKCPQMKNDVRWSRKRFFMVSSVPPMYMYFYVAVIPSRLQITFFHMQRFICVYVNARVYVPVLSTSILLGSVCDHKRMHKHMKIQGSCSHIVHMLQRHLHIPPAGHN